VTGWFVVLEVVEVLFGSGQHEFVAILPTCLMVEQRAWLAPEGAKRNSEP
jgi:hypothetical protein